MKDCFTRWLSRKRRGRLVRRGGGTDREEEEVLGRPASPDGSVEEEEIAAPEGEVTALPVV